MKNCRILQRFKAYPLLTFVTIKNCNNDEVPAVQPQNHVQTDAYTNTKINNMVLIQPTNDNRATLNERDDERVSYNF